jgi:23S rRNA pseudouridine1911/1915/1917 synthase
MEVKHLSKQAGFNIISKPAGITMDKLARFGLPAHRLDRYTSGLLILAKNNKTLSYFQSQFKQRKVDKRYLALVLGNPPTRGKIEGYLARDPSRKRPFIFSLSAVGRERGQWRWSKSTYQTMKRFVYNGKNLSLLEVKILTGRTHQIRLHLSSQGFPILGDRVYNVKESRQLSEQLKVPRQFLHAGWLAFRHPVTGKKMRFKDRLPSDLEKILAKLK